MSVQGIKNACANLIIVLLILTNGTQAETLIPNSLIDYPRFAGDVVKAEALRASHRLTEDQFLAEMKKPHVVILDARSTGKFQLRHLKGSVNLALPDFTADDLAKIIPTKNSKILIYCNNNFLGSPSSFPTKAPGASLNLSTFVTLITYGYTNVYELGPLIDIRAAKLPFEGSEVNERSGHLTAS